MSQFTDEKLKQIDQEAVILRRKKKFKDFLQTVGDHSALITMSVILHSRYLWSSSFR